MTEITLSKEQAEILRQAKGGVLLRDEAGICLAAAHRLAHSPEQVAELENRLDEDVTWRTTEEVLERLR